MYKNLSDDIWPQYNNINRTPVNNVHVYIKVQYSTKGTNDTNDTIYQISPGQSPLSHV